MYICGKQGKNIATYGSQQTPPMQDPAGPCSLILQVPTILKSFAAALLCLLFF